MGVELPNVIAIQNSHDFWTIKTVL